MPGILKKINAYLTLLEQGEDVAEKHLRLSWDTLCYPEQVRPRRIQRLGSVSMSSSFTGDFQILIAGC